MLRQQVVGKPSALYIYLAVLLLGIFFARMITSIPHLSMTFDEEGHVTVGYNILRTGDLRLAYFDCTQSWLHPEGGSAPGWLVLARDAPAWIAKYLASARLSYEQERGGFSAPFRIYTDDGRPTYPTGGCVHVALSELPLADVLNTPTIDLPVTLEGGLTLIGYALSQPAIKSGETLYLETTWRVDAAPGRLLSVKAHIVGEDGRAVAVGDGLGVPIESWQAGDVFVQRHTLTLPAGTSPGSYWIQTGVYWLDNGQRWPARDDRAMGDRALLVALEVQ